MKEKSTDSASQKKRKRKRGKKKKKSTEEGGCRQSQPENAAVKTTEEEPSERFRGDETCELQERTSVPSEKKKLEEVQLRAGGHGPAAQTPGTKRKIKRRAAQNGHIPSANEETAVTRAPTPAKKKKIQEEASRVEEEDGISMVTAVRKKRKKRKLPAAKIKADSKDEATAPPEVKTQGSTSEKKKKKIPVVFEFEADELQNFTNGDTTEATAVS